MANNPVIPSAKEALDKFKMEAAGDVGEAAPYQEIVHTGPRCVNEKIEKRYS